MKPASIFAGCSFPCGTRAAYSAGCRCAPCRAANTAYARERAAQQIAAVERAPASGAGAGAVAQQWTTRSGKRQVRHYKRACPGVRGEPCRTRSHLRCDSKGGLCGTCRKRAAFQGLVPAARARAHLQRLVKAGIGNLSVAIASDVSRTTLHEISHGNLRMILADTERRILNVDEGARADRAAVPAGPTWRAVDELVRMGWTKGAIARALGSAKPVLQLGRERVTAAHECAVLELLRKAKAELARTIRCPRCRLSHQDDPLAAKWCREHPDIQLTPRELMRVIPAD